MHRPLIRASLVTLLFALVWSSRLPVSAAPLNQIPPPQLTRYYSPKESPLRLHIRV